MQTFTLCLYNITILYYTILYCTYTSLTTDACMWEECEVSIVMGYKTQHFDSKPSSVSSTVEVVMFLCSSLCSVRFDFVFQLCCNITIKLVVTASGAA